MSIRVVARIRPPTQSELSKDIIVTTAHRSLPSNDSTNSKSDRPTVVKVPNPKNPSELYSFQFNGVYDSDATQQDVFENEIAPTVKSLFKGVDVTIFAYGVTGTGKTFTMRGGKSLADRGIIPRLLSGAYRRARKLDKDSGGQTKFDISLSYYEIYNDKVYDLFEPPEKRTLAGLPIRDNCGKTVVVGLTERPCANLKDFENLYEQANINRSTSSTKLNAASSRSHAILAIKLTTTSGDEIRISTASAIDLAGSEDNRRTENGKDRMVESAAINKSLFTLAKCVEAISQNQSRIPYRESKMTRILSLGQNSGLTVMILNLAPVQSYHLDTLSSLNFANRTKKIEVREIENEPMFKGCAKAVTTVGGGTAGRQPLRPLSTAVQNSLGNMTNTMSNNPGKPKSFMVYSDRLSGPKGGRTSLKRRSDAIEQDSQHPTKRRNHTAVLVHHGPSLSNRAIEDMIERKIADALAARALDQHPANIEPEISAEVQRRLDMIEKRIEDQGDSTREQGLTFLLCAKQHTVRGEDRSALKMYTLAQEYFPDNPRLAQKIERLQQKLEPAKNLSHGGEKLFIHKEIGPNRTSDAESDEDYEDKTIGKDGEESDNDHITQANHKPAKKRQQARTRVTSNAVQEKEASLSPVMQRLLQIINSRDPSVIGGLQGVGPKRAANIVEELSREYSEPLSSITQLRQVKGVGLKVVEKMRAGLAS